jgi:hypothetical protein
MQNLTPPEERLRAAAMTGAARVAASGLARVVITPDPSGRTVITITMQPGPVQDRCRVVSALATALGVIAGWERGAYRAAAQAGPVLIEVSYRPPDLLAPGPVTGTEAAPELAGAAA